MHICHFCETSVGSDYFKNMSTGLLEKGADVSLVELGTNNPPVWLKDLPEVKYFSLNATKRSQYPAAIPRLRKLLESEEVDVLQAHLFYAGLISVCTKPLKRRTKFAIMRHHTSVVRMLGSPIHAYLDRWMARRADHLLTVSNAARDYMRDVDNIDRQIEVVYLGFDFSRFAPNENARVSFRKEMGFDADDVVIGYVGNFAPGKGHLQLVEAFSEIAAAVPNAKLLFIGRGELKEVSDALKRLSLSEKVFFGGWQDDVSRCLNAMDVFVQPSLSEAFSQVLIEAMGVGLPVVATDVGGANEVIVDGENGFLIEPGDPGAIAARVISLLNDVELSRCIAAKGQATVLERFTVQHMVDQQFKLYEEWLEN